MMRVAGARRLFGFRSIPTIAGQARLRGLWPGTGQAFVARPVFRLIVFFHGVAAGTQGLGSGKSILILAAAHPGRAGTGFRAF